MINEYGYNTEERGITGLEGHIMRSGYVLTDEKYFSKIWLIALSQGTKRAFILGIYLQSLLPVVLNSIMTTVRQGSHIIVKPGKYFVAQGSRRILIHLRTMATSTVNLFYIMLQKPYLIIIYTTEFLLSASWSFVVASIKKMNF